MPSSCFWDGVDNVFHLKVPQDACFCVPEAENWCFDVSQSTPEWAHDSWFNQDKIPPYIFKGLFYFVFYVFIFLACANFDLFFLCITCFVHTCDSLKAQCRRIYCLSLKRRPLLPIHSITRGCESELKSSCCNLRQSQTKGKVPSERGTKKWKLKQPSSNRVDVCSSWQTDIVSPVAEYDTIL